VSVLPRWQQTDYWRSLPRWKQVVLENADLFILRYFPHRIDALEDFHYDLINTALEQVRGLVLYPAGHGKTTLVSTILPVLRICRDPDWREVIIAKNDEEADGIMAVIQTELVDNDLLVRDFGPFKPSDPAKPWALGRMQVEKRTRRAKEATITVFGSGAKTVLGYRSDHTTCDDVVTGENSASPTQREKTRNWFDQSVETGPEHEDSGLTVVGTRFDPHDLYGDLKEMLDPATGQNIWHVDEIDAIVDEENHITRWPARWSWERLMQQKAKGTLNFNKRYRNIAVDASRQVVKEAYITGGWFKGVQYPGCLDRQFSIGTYERGLWRAVAGFDPAGGKSRHAKFCAHAIWAEGSCRDHERCYWVLDLQREQWTLPQMVERILDAHQKIELQSTQIEANAFQIGLQEAVMQKMNERGMAYTVEPHYTSRTNKPDPETGVSAMSPWFEQGKVHIPWGDPHSQRVMGQLVDELVTYPDARTTDTVMASWFAWRKLEQSAPKFQSFNRLERQSSRRPWLAASARRSIRNPAYPPREREAV
jgi:predicted phage terminase large subunit-like protein